MNRLMPAALVLFLAAALATATQAAGQPTNADRADAGGFALAAEALIEQRIDQQRATLAPDAPALASDPDLTDIARTRSHDMAHGAAFAHEDGNGRFVAGDMVKSRFGPYGAIGENIMEMGGSRDFDAEEFAKVAVEGWMKSPGHRANILNPAYAMSGIGVAIYGDTAYATQVFFGPPESGQHARR